LTGLYAELVDSQGHNYGPESNEIIGAMKLVDSELVRLLDVLEETSNINLMIFSDHGMAERLGGAQDATRGIINVLDYVNSSDWAHAAGSASAPGLQLWPKSDNEDWVSLTVLHSSNFGRRKGSVLETYRYGGKVEW